MPPSRGFPLPPPPVGEVLLVAVKDNMQAFAAQQVHSLAFLVGLHAGGDHHTAHDSVQQSGVTKLQHAYVLKGRTCHTALRLTLH